MTGKQTVVIADDSNVFRIYFSILLGRMNYEVMPVASGREAFDLSRAVSPHLISLSLSGDSNGLETLQQIRSDARLAETPVMVIADDAGDAGACFAGGCNNFLTKPIDLDQLHNALQNCRRTGLSSRRHLRAPFDREVRYIHEGRQSGIQAVTLSEGGIFLQTGTPLPIGSRVEVDIPLAEREWMPLSGEVIYTMQGGRKTNRLPAGMAVRFDDCSSAMQQRISEEVRQLLAGDILDLQDQSWFATPAIPATGPC